MKTLLKIFGGLLVVGVFLAGCSDSGDAYLGKWQNLHLQYISIEITKHDGGNGYTLTRYGQEHEVLDTYSGIADGKTLVFSSVMGSVPAEIKNGQIELQIMPNCHEAGCDKWKKISN